MTISTMIGSWCFYLKNWLQILSHSIERYWNFWIFPMTNMLISPSSIENIDSIHPDIKKRIDVVNMGTLDISATDIRQRVSCGKSVRYLTPPNVIDYIEKNGLYSTGPER